jgi:chorismate-pyruvate lyase
MHDAVDPLELIATFYERSAALAQLEACERPLPAPYGQLLDHDEHMTETVEAFYGAAVGVRVLQTQYEHGRYTREIILHRREADRDLADSLPVLYGIVRLRPDLLQPTVWAEIESQQTPLGHVLIAHNVLRHVALERLWRVSAGPGLRAALGLTGPATGPTEPPTTFGRTARIVCDGQPAIELLEIAAPASCSSNPATA